MAIRLITGVPGSGKSYYAVRHLRNTYCEYDKQEKTWYLKEGYTVITNIDNLLIEHLHLESILEKTGKQIGDFFTEEYQKKISIKYPKIIYFLDEAQKYFPKRNRYTEKTWFYFQYHRHMGHDVYLMTQDMRTMPIELTCLAEYEIRACPRTLSVFGEMKYNVKAGREIIDRKVIRKDKSIFALYKSMDVEESEKIKNPFRKWFVLFAVLLVCSVYYTKDTFIGSGGKKGLGARSANAKEIEIESGPVLQTKDGKKIIGVNAYSKNPFQYEERKIRYLVDNYYTIGKVLFILDPVSEQFYGKNQFPYKLIIKRYGKFLRIYAELPETDYNYLIDKEKNQSGQIDYFSEFGNAETGSPARKIKRQYQ